MKTLLLTKTGKAGKAFRSFVPKAGWEVKALDRNALTKMAAPDLTLVELSSSTKPIQIKQMIHSVAPLQKGGGYVLFTVDRNVPKPQTFQKKFQQLVNAVNSGLVEFPNPDRVDITAVGHGDELGEKLYVIEAKLNLAAEKPRPSPLDQVTAVVEAVNHLRENNGNLSAKRIANEFGISLNQIATWIGRSRQALNKTPDADSVQDDLSIFERVARLRVVVSEEAFRKWLRMRHAQLDNKSPLELLAAGEGQVIADLVDDMLTGAPA